MAVAYTLLPPTLPGLQTILRVDELGNHAFIPADPANVDFQAYQAWLEAGNVPDPPSPGGLMDKANG